METAYRWLTARAILIVFPATYDLAQACWSLIWENLRRAFAISAGH